MLAHLSLMASTRADLETPGCIDCTYSNNNKLASEFDSYIATTINRTNAYYSHIRIQPFMLPCSIAR